jgi:hypothetical protein
VSVNKHVREMWCKRVLEEAVREWNVERLKPENDHINIAQLAVDISWRVFHRNGRTLFGSVEVASACYARMAYERFNDECNRALTAPTVEAEAEEMVA